LALSHGKRQKLDSAIVLAKGDSKFQALIELFGVLPLKLDSILYQKTLLPWLFTEAFYSTPGRANNCSTRFRNIHSYQHPTDSIIRAEQFSIAIRQTALQTFLIPLVVVGREDLVTPVKFSEQLAQGIPNAELVILDRGHAFVVESAETVVKKCSIS